MKTILIFVSTLDGKVTKWGDSHVASWSSQQDQEYFKKTWNESPLIIMGSNTFNANPHNASPNHLLVIMTGSPDKYKRLEVPGQLEFTNQSPLVLSARFREKGHERMLVVGGAHVAVSFLKEQLIDELWLTMEPRIFGQGGNFVTEEKLDINLRLIQSEKVNEAGTLINKYEVLTPHLH
jgi:dihydrofolate reductase